MAAERRIQTQPGAEAQAPARRYQVQGTVIEACDCDTLCPCYIGEDPTNGACQAIFAYHIDSGQISGIDVSGLTVVAVVETPGNMDVSNWRRTLLVDDKGSHDQLVALGDAFEGRLGGPLADLAGLVSEAVGVFEAPISYSAAGGEGTLSVGDKVQTTLTPVTLRPSMAPVDGSPESAPTPWAGKASETSVNLPEHGIQWSVQGRHASQSSFQFEA
jgi:hypothetical protein